MTRRRNPVVAFLRQPAREREPLPPLVRWVVLATVVATVVVSRYVGTVPGVVTQLAGCAVVGALLLYREHLHRRARPAPGRPLGGSRLPPPSRTPFPEDHHA